MLAPQVYRPAIASPPPEATPARMDAAPAEKDIWGSTDLIRAFLSGRSARTVAAYRSDLEAFAGWLGEASVGAAANALLANGNGRANSIALAYRTALIERGLSPSTTNRRLAALRSLVKMARTLGLITWSLDVEGLDRCSYRDTRGPGSRGFAALLTELHGRTDAKAVRDRAILWLLYGRGLRRGEVAGLDLVHVDLERGTVAVLAKGRLERQPVTIPAPAVEALRDWMRERSRIVGGSDHFAARDSGALFVPLDRSSRRGRLTGRSIERMVTALGEAAGIRARPHGLRHAAVTAALDLSGGDIRAAQRFARHADPRTTMIYDDNRQDVGGELARRVADAVEAHGC